MFSSVAKMLLNSMEENEKRNIIKRTPCTVITEIIIKHRQVLLKLIWLHQD